jgi:peptidoglycan/LPS O-acetylase OafA/YrhL
MSKKPIAFPQKMGGRLPILDALRIFACLSVILMHYEVGSRGHIPWQTFNTGEFLPTWTRNPIILYWTRFGYMGVDLFFLLSGAVIFKTANNRTANQFLIARIKRLFPIYLMICFPTFLIYRFLSPARYSFRDALHDISFQNGFQGKPQLIAAAWTLNVEVIFYLLIAIILLFRQKIESEAKKPSLLNVLIFMLLINWVYGIQNLPAPLNIMGLQGYAIYFLAGAIIAGFADKSQEYHPLIRVLIYLIILNSLEIQIHARLFGTLGTQSTTLQNLSSIVVSIITFIILYIGVRFGAASTRSTRLLSKVAIATYPLYLLHLQIGLFVITFLVNHIYSNKLEVGIFVILMQMFLSLGLIELGNKVNKRIEKKWFPSYKV